MRWSDGSPYKDMLVEGYDNVKKKFVLTGGYNRRAQFATSRRLDFVPRKKRNPEIGLRGRNSR
jgi:hypothetical protein